MANALFERMLAEESKSKEIRLKFISVFFVIPPHQLCFITLMSNPFRFFVLFSLVILSSRTEAKQNPHYLAADTLQIDSVFYSPAQDTISPHIFMVTLTEGLDSMNATVNANVMFVARRGDCMLYWGDPHTAFLPDGRSGYIPPAYLETVEVPCFKFNFSAHSFTYEKIDELYQAALRTGMDLNELVQRIRKKDSEALLKFFELRYGVDGAAWEIYQSEFWRIVHLWSDEELAVFISGLPEEEKLEFCSKLVDSSFYDPDKYYPLHYPLTWKHIEATK